MCKYELCIYVLCSRNAEIRIIYIYIYLYTHTCKHTYKYAHVQTQTQMTHSEIFTHASIHIGMDASKNTHSQTITHTQSSILSFIHVKVKVNFRFEQATTSSVRNLNNALFKAATFSFFCRMCLHKG